MSVNDEKRRWASIYANRLRNQAGDMKVAPIAEVDRAMWDAHQASCLALAAEIETKAAALEP